MFSSISFGIINIIDILLVATVLFIAYRLLRGTVATNIIIGIIFLFILWRILDGANMKLTSGIFGAFFEVGILALLIVFQQEVRRFLQVLGSRYRWRNLFNPKEFFSSTPLNEEHACAIVNACMNLSQMRTGALIVIARNNLLDNYVNTGVVLKSEISQELIENIFFKNTPLHDGAVILDQEQITAARCILPVSDRQDIPGSMGLRHRAALGLSAVSDAFIVVVSEETGKISLFRKDDYRLGVTPTELKDFIDGKDFQ